MFGTFKLFCVFSIALGLGAEPAPEAGFSGPLIGFVFDEQTRRIHPLTGTPGAALVGSAIANSEPEQALVANDGRFAVVAVPGMESLGYTRPLDAGSHVSAIEGSMSSFDKGALSPASSSSIVFGPGCQCVQVLSELRTAPQVIRTVALPESVRVLALAVSDDASVFAIAARREPDAATLSIYVRGQDLPVTELPVTAGALAFSADGNTLAVSDAARKNVSLVWDVKGAAEIFYLAAEREDIQHPVDVRFASVSKLLVADTDRGVHILDLKSRELRSVECACKATAVAPTSHPNVFRLTGADSGAVWILELLEEGARTMFIPLAEERK